MKGRPSVGRTAPGVRPVRTASSRGALIELMKAPTSDSNEAHDKSLSEGRTISQSLGMLLTCYRSISRCVEVIHRDRLSTILSA